MLARLLTVFNWDDLKVFLAAYRAGSIGRAAEVLGLSGSTVSRRLASLEESLGASLFVRTPDGLRVTDDGERAWRAAQEAENSAARVQALVSERGAARGTVRVSVATGLLANILLPHWHTFAARYPDVTVEFIESTALVDLERWEADIAIRNVRPSHGDELVFTKVRETHLGLFASERLLARLDAEADHPPVAATIGGGDGTGIPFVDWVPELVGLDQARTALFPRATVVLRGHSMETLRCAAAAGVGVALLPTFFGRLTPTLVELPCQRIEPMGPPLYLVGHSALRDTPRVDAVWQFLDELLRGDDSSLPLARERLSAAYGVGRPAPGGAW